MSETTILELVQMLAWPVAALVIVAILHKPISTIAVMIFRALFHE